MSKKILWLCIFTIVLVVGITFACCFPLIKSKVNKNSRYTYEQIQQAEQQGYDKAYTEVIKLNDTLNTYIDFVDNLQELFNLNKEDSLNNKFLIISTQFNDIKTQLNYYLTLSPTYEELQDLYTTSQETILNLQNQLLNAYEEYYNQGYNKGYEDGVNDKEQNTYNVVIFYDMYNNVLSTKYVKDNTILSDITPVYEMPNAHYEFLGWTLDGETILNSDYQITNSMNLKPKYNYVELWEQIELENETSFSYSKTFDIAGLTTENKFRVTITKIGILTHLGGIFGDVNSYCMYDIQSQEYKFSDESNVGTFIIENGQEFKVYIVNSINEVNVDLLIKFECLENDKLNITCSFSSDLDIDFLGATITAIEVYR